MAAASSALEGCDEPRGTPSAATVCSHEPSELYVSTEHKRPREAANLYAACLGELGQFGNQLFQFFFALAYSERWGLRLLTPDWVGARCLAGAADKVAAATLPPQNERLVLADRVVLSHAGWRQWVQQREPLATVLRREGASELSGRRLRQACPQVNATAIAAGGDAKCACVAREQILECLARRRGTLELWGFFQFDTAVFATHRALLQRCIVPVAPLQRLVQDALLAIRAGRVGGSVAGATGGSTARGGGTTLVCIHVRCNDDVRAYDAEAYQPCERNHAGADTSWRRRGRHVATDETPSASSAPDKQCESASPGPPQPGPVDLPSEWRDEGVFWAAPVAWYAEWLRAIWPTLTAPVLVLCTDRPERALRDGELAAFQPVLLGAHLRQRRELWDAAHGACGSGLSDGALMMLCDWEAMRMADVLAINQSTFSFTAAMLAEPRALEGEARRGDERVARWWRPSPGAAGLVPFDPWDAQVLPNACESGTQFRRARAPALAVAPVGEAGREMPMPAKV